MPRDEKNESLETEIEQVLEEARMVLPGLQALFGFQLIAVFSERFENALGTACQQLHLGAVVLTAVAIGLIMAPAAYHRQAERGRASRYFANYASRLITLAMGPLAVALAIEVALVAFLILGNVPLSVVVGIGLILVLAWLWYLYPMTARRKR
jgi:hypothetical protein